MRTSSACSGCIWLCARLTVLNDCDTATSTRESLQQQHACDSTVSKCSRATPTLVLIPVLRTSTYLRRLQIPLKVPCRPCMLCDSTPPALYCRCVLPIAGLFAISLWLGNAAYLYLSVSFIQMLKVGPQLASGQQGPAGLATVTAATAATTARQQWAQLAARVLTVATAPHFALAACHTGRATTMVLGAQCHQCSLSAAARPSNAAVPAAVPSQQYQAACMPALPPSMQI
jgi:hypothetical protein